MNVDGLIALAAGGGLGLAAAMVLALSALRSRRRTDTADEKSTDPELRQAAAQAQASIDKGRRSY